MLHKSKNSPRKRRAKRIATMGRYDWRRIKRVPHPRRSVRSERARGHSMPFATDLSESPASYGRGGFRSGPQYRHKKTGGRPARFRQACPQAYFFFAAGFFAAGFFAAGLVAFAAGFFADAAAFGAAAFLAAGFAAAFFAAGFAATLPRFSWPRAFWWRPSWPAFSELLLPCRVSCKWQHSA